MHMLMHAFKCMVARSKRIIIMHHNIFPVIQVQLICLLLDNVYTLCLPVLLHDGSPGSWGTYHMTVEENKDCSITTDSVHKKET